MGEIAAPFALAVGAYVLLVIGVGVASTRRAGRSPEEFFLAGRGLGSAVLFMALFGTNCTAFVLVGIPGRAYHDGIGVFGLNAPIVALGIPLSFWAIGVPARRMAHRIGALTPAELYAKSLGSRGVGVLLFAFFTLYTVPYMVTAVDGAARVLEEVAGVESAMGGGMVLALALLYTSLGGMRATAWTNVIQGALFMAFMALAFVGVSSSLGGLTASMERVRELAPERLVRPDTGLFEPRAFASWSIAISATVIAFPHMLVRLFTARDEKTLRTICRLYPVALVALWLPAVMLGVWGAAEFPGLVGPESDAIFAKMVLEHLPAWGAAAGFLAVLAAVMSTLDAQLLTLGSMLCRDVLPRGGAASDLRDVRLGRAFSILVGLAVLAVWHFSGDSIFSLASISFSGYVTLVPLLLLGVRWRRLTPAGAMASMIAGNAAYLGSIAASSAPLERAALSPSLLGFLPVVWGLLAAALAAVVVSGVTSRDEALAARAFGEA